MTILVTGATGNVGREIVNQLLRKNQQVRALTRDPSTARLPKEAEVVKGDLSHPETLTSVLDGVTAMHWISVYEDEALHAVNEVATLVKNAGVQRATIMTGGGDETVV
ncbi:SDR family oxidoreductase [Amphibacillus sediminis]|uniref:SDR family oxidoreductase n=1 Tax=Amphibacillus sediminis TaxID=360185 RepID=UPI0008330718|nr:SDR family NAD(P)-dependent oxidoreductase [Amphibacillus sediminis]